MDTLPHQQNFHQICDHFALVYQQLQNLISLVENRQNLSYLDIELEGNKTKWPAAWFELW